MLIEIADDMTDVTGTAVPYSNAQFINGYGFEVFGDIVYWDIVLKPIGRR